MKLSWLLSLLVSSVGTCNIIAFNGKELLDDKRKSAFNPDDMNCKANQSCRYRISNRQSDLAEPSCYPEVAQT